MENTTNEDQLKELHSNPQFWVANAEIRIQELKNMWDKFGWEDHEVMFPYFQRRIHQLQNELIEAKQKLEACTTSN
jgi:hypothetical protein